MAVHIKAEMKNNYPIHRFCYVYIRIRIVIQRPIKEVCLQMQQLMAAIRSPPLFKEKFTCRIQS